MMQQRITALDHLLICGLSTNVVGFSTWDNTSTPAVEKEGERK
jgi:hypothetical protein